MGGSRNPRRGSADRHPQHPAHPCRRHQRRDRRPGGDPGARENGWTMRWPGLALLLAGALTLGPTLAQGAQAADPDERTVELPTGIAMRYAEAGDPDGEVVLFVHGYTDSHTSFRPTIGSLLARRPGVRALAVDLRGHG